MWSDNYLRRNNFDIIRFSMALLVIFSHSFTLLSGAAHDAEPLRRLNHNSLSFGEISVNVFFIISGFLITMSWERSKSTFSYLRKRIARIVPGFVVACVITTFIVSPWFVADRSHVFSWPNIRPFFTNLATLQQYDLPDVVPHNPFPSIINGSLWTITFEFRCYLAVILLAACTLIRRRWPILLILSLLIILSQQRLFQHLGFDVTRLPISENFRRFGTFFLAGMVFYLYRAEIPSNLALLAISIILFTAIAFTWRGGSLLPIPLAYISLWLAFQPYVRFPNFAKYGDISYGVYLYAFLIQQVLIALWQPYFNPITLFLAATALSIPAGIASWYLIERHFVARKKKVLAPLPVLPTPAPDFVSASA